MGFTKNRGLVTVIAIIVLILFSVSAFLLPFAHTLVFWASYVFGIFSVLMLLMTAILAMNNEKYGQTFYRLSAVNLAFIYFVIQLIFSLWQMASQSLPSMFVIVACGIMAGIFIILLMLTYMSIEKVQQTGEKIAEKTFYIKSLQSDIDLLETDDTVLSSKLRELSETIRFSDPMSHSQLAEIENKIENKCHILAKNLKDIKMSLSICDDLQLLFKQRNQKCKLLKNVPEPRGEKDNSGVKYVALATGICTAMAAVIMIITFVVTANSKYYRAIELYQAERYEEAIAAFEDLGKYRDSVDKIALAKQEIQVRDESILAEKYQQAEEFLIGKNYIEAIDAFTELGDYKDAKDRIEEICNMFSDGGEAYFGRFENQPILWQMLRTEPDRMLLITKEPITLSAFNDEMKNITWENSSIRSWLNGYFLNEFSQEQLSRIIKISDDDLDDDGIFILSKDEYEKYIDDMSVSDTLDWWLRTKTPAGMMYVKSGTGEIDTYGEGVVRAKGVRPCVWIDLK